MKNPVKFYHLHITQSAYIPVDGQGYFRFLKGEEYNLPYEIAQILIRLNSASPILVTSEPYTWERDA